VFESKQPTTLQNLFFRKRVLVFGYGVSGKQVAAYLRNINLDVYVWDDSEEQRNQAKQDGFTISDVSSVHVIIVSPGIPVYHGDIHPFIRLAKKRNIQILGDLDLFYLEYGDRVDYLGITGTNGKSTTSALVYHILQHCQKNAYLAGNIGTSPIALDLQEGDNKPVLALEVSSFQLEINQKIGFEYASLLNIQADHLDRYGNFENYIAVKKQIIAASKVAFIGIDNVFSRRAYDDVCDDKSRRIIPISILEELKYGVYVVDGYLYDALELEASAIKVARVAGAAHLRGVHNLQNIAFAYAMARLHGCERDEIITAVMSFPGLRHRQQIIKTCRGIRYVNDSKATNIDATIRALECYDNIYWLVGGRAKKEPLDLLTPYLKKIRKAYCYGESAKKFHDFLATNNVMVESFNNMEDAFARAYYNANNEMLDDATVILSPACASFDQFKNFEQRGDNFVSLVNQAMPAINQQKAET
jgi:UDP-N-acetylmuramoylalanine--D-glutamate ligase